jgi:glycosyltransferase involved in cell wall biosynthesis
MRAVVISENMGAPMDEGIRKFATMLVAGLARHCEVSGIYTGSGTPSRLIEFAPAGKLFRGRALENAIRAANPGLVVYVPSASGTLFSFLRSRALKSAAPRARVAMVITQPRGHSLPVRKLLRLLAPEETWCQSRGTGYYFQGMGIRASFLPSGVDLDAFRPVSPAEKAALRDKYGLPQDEYLVLHAGHLKQGRNLGLLAQLKGIGRGVVLASRRMGAEPGVLESLRAAGVVVIDRYIEAAQELYQAADCYLFPTRQADSAMEFPLSVLEAMACNLPVVTYPYGGLPDALEPRDGLVFAETGDKMIKAVGLARETAPRTREQAEKFAWEKIAQTLLGMKSERDAGAFAAAL